MDLFHAHIGGMDAFARGLKTAAAIVADGRLAALVEDRYACWDGDLAKEVEAGPATSATSMHTSCPREKSRQQCKRKAGNARKPDQRVHLRSHAAAALESSQSADCRCAAIGLHSNLRRRFAELNGKVAHTQPASARWDREIYETGAVR